VRLVKHIHKLLHDEANATLKSYGINHPEYNLMMMLYGSASGTMSPSELADAAGEKSANITRLTNELCDKGLIARTASVDDRRKIALNLTAQGEALIESFLPDICALLTRQMRHMTVSEQNQFEKLLKKFLSGLAD
jgi:MarR family transcriptional regulator, negative regulator of the multidrug operon emrRAB